MLRLTIGSFKKGNKEIGIILERLYKVISPTFLVAGANLEADKITVDTEGNRTQ